MADVQGQLPQGTWSHSAPGLTLEALVPEPVLQVYEAAPKNGALYPIESAPVAKQDSKQMWVVISAIVMSRQTIGVAHQAFYSTQINQHYLSSIEV